MTMLKKLSHLSLLAMPLMAGGAFASQCVEHPGHGIMCTGNASTTTSGGTLPVVVQTDFSTAVSDLMLPVEEQETAASAEGGLAGRPAIGLECGWSSNSMNGDTSVCTMPLSYTIHNEIDPRRRLVLKLPVTWVDSDNPASPGETFHVGVGASYTFPVASRWYVTPGLTYSYADEGDFGQKADLTSASIASAYFYKYAGYDFGIGNMFTYARTINETGGHPGYHFSALRNGLMVSKDTNLLGRRLYWEGSLIATLFFGDQNYANSQIEASLTFGDKRSLKASAGGYRFGASLFNANKTSGGKLTFGYWF